MMFQGLKTSRNYSLQYIKNLCNPKNVYICDGSKQEYDRMAAKLVRNGTFTKLSRPNSYLANSHPNDVTDMEDRTFICSSDIDDAGPTNNWYNPGEMKIKMESLFKGSMKGRTMYIIPFRLGPKGEFSINGLQITDSPYVVCNMHITTQVGANDKPPMLCMHSVGKPLKEKEHDVAWPCDVKNKYITHFIENKEVWSYGSGYGDNALLGGKCLALRLASVIAKKEGWLAENMSIIGLTNPEGKKIYIAVAFPNSCGKTNLSMLNSKLPGWKITTVGDNIAWMHVRNGNLYAVNPEVGFYSSAWGISEVSNPNAMEVCKENAIFTNTALTNENDVWWEGMTKIPPDDLID